MLSFDTTVVNAYLMCVFSIAAIAVVLSIGLATTEVVRGGRLRVNGGATTSGSGGSEPGPVVDVPERPDVMTDDGGELVDAAVGGQSRPAWTR